MMLKSMRIIYTKIAKSDHYSNKNNLAALLILVVCLCLILTIQELKGAQGGNHVKIWPAKTLRGLNTKLVFPTHKNQTNPGGFLSDTIFRTFKEWRINVIRVPIGVDRGSVWDVKKGDTLPPIPPCNPMAPYSKHLQGLEMALNLAEEYDIYVIVTAGNIAGRKIDVMYHEGDGRGYYRELTKLWQYVAQKFGRNKKLLGYDLLNEPVEKRGQRNWRRVILPKLIEAIRKVDKNTYLIIEPAPWGSYKAFRNFKPVEYRKVVYSFHFYTPHNYTHQGIGKRPRGLKYPGYLRHFNTSPIRYWDRKQLEKQLDDAIEFQNKYKVRMLVGEFGVVRWAPGGVQWLEDAISIFEKYGWDWCYHSYGGWNGFNPTFNATDPQSNEINGGEETRRLQILKRAWMKNRE